MLPWKASWLLALTFLAAAHAYASERFIREFRLYGDRKGHEVRLELTQADNAMRATPYVLLPEKTLLRFRSFLGPDGPVPESREPAGLPKTLAASGCAWPGEAVGTGTDPSREGPRETAGWPALLKGKGRFMTWEDGHFSLEPLFDAAGRVKEGLDRLRAHLREDPSPPAP